MKNRSAYIFSVVTTFQMDGFSYERFTSPHKKIFKAALAERIGTTVDQIVFSSVSDVPTPAPTPSGMLPGYANTRLLARQDEARRLQIIDRHLDSLHQEEMVPSAIIARWRDVTKGGGKARGRDKERALIAAWCWCSGLIIQLSVKDVTKDRGDRIIRDINVIHSAPQDFDSRLLEHYLAVDDESVQPPPNLGTSVTMVPYLQRHFAAGSAEAMWWREQSKGSDDDGQSLLVSGDQKARRQAVLAVALPFALSALLAAAL
jgi:hypothetical protein